MLSHLKVAAILSFLCFITGCGSSQKDESPWEAYKEHQGEESIRQTIITPPPLPPAPVMRDSMK